MKNLLKITAAVGLAVLLLTVLILPITDAKAANTDLTTVIDFIDDVRLTDRAGNPFGADIDKDAELLLTYEFSIANDADVFDTDYYLLPVPDEILLTAGPDLEIRHQTTNDLIATVSKDLANQQLKVTFTEHVSLNSNVQGEFGLELSFDESHIGTADPTYIHFEVGGVTDAYVIEIDFDQPPPPEVDVAKTGTYDEATREITWTVTVNSNQVEMTDGKLTETIPEGLAFVPGSVDVKEGSAAWRDAVLDTDYTYDSGTLEYTFTTPTSDTQLVRFNTTIDDSQFRSDPDDPDSDYVDHGSTVPIGNQVTLTYGGETKFSNNANVNVPVNFIEKTGTYDSANKKIDWVITVNKTQLTVPDAVVTDTIPSRLILDTGSVQFDGTPVFVTTPPDVPGPTHFDDPDFSMILGAIAEPHVITFSTTLDPTLFEENGPESGFIHEFTNTAVLIGTDVPLGTDDENDEPIEVTSNVIDKTGHGYDPETQEITWWITVNTNEITIDGGEITDNITAGQTFKPGSVRVNEPVTGWRDASTPTDYDFSGSTLTYTLPASISDVYIVEFKTTVDNPNHYAANSSQTYYNDATLTWGAGNSETDRGSETVRSEVLQKTCTGYNYETRRLSWRIQVNENEMDLGGNAPNPGPVITDVVDGDQQLVLGSFNITSAGGMQTGMLTEDLTGWTYTFDGMITDEYIITFDTEVTDLTRFATNGNKTFSNQATLTTDLVPTGVASSGSRSVKNTIIDKTGDYTEGNTYIDWTINVNTNSIPLSDAVITDQLQDGLSLDTSSVKLVHATVHPTSGDLVPGEAIALTGANVSYSVDTNLFELTLPAPVQGSYILTFRTDVTDKTQSPFQNYASFNGTGTEQLGDSGQIPVSWSGAGSSGTSEVGSMNILKKDAEDFSALSGAAFELEDKYGNIVQRVTSDASGSALFERLRFDVDYTVRETAAPQGYQLNPLEHTFQIDSALDDKNIEYTFTNDRILGIVQVTKYGQGVGPLAGAEFTLFDGGGDSVMTAVSGNNGVALFENVRWGTYTIRETNPPEGFLISDVVHSVTVTDHNVHVEADPVSQTDERIIGSIRLLKTNSNDEPLAGAEYALYGAADTAFDSPLMTAVSGADGVVRFDNVFYGDYLLRETIAPSGYTRSPAPVAVSVKDHGIEVDAGTVVNLSYAETTGSIRLLKTDSDDEPLADAEFSLYDAADTAYDNPLMTAVSSADGIVRFELVPYGDYLLRETDAPHGYSRNRTPVAVSVREPGIEVDAGTVINYRYGERPPSPETGSRPHAALLMLLCAGLSLGSVLLVDGWLKKKYAEMKRGQ